MLGPPANLVLAPVLIGTLFNVLLFGIVIAQTYLYFTTYKRDRTWMKLLVLSILVIDTFNTIFNVIYVYECVITHYGELEALAKATWSLNADPLLTGVIELIVQLFFAWRVHVLTRNWFLVAAVLGCCLAGGVGAFVTTYKALVIPEFARFQEFKNVVIVWLVCSSAADVLIAAILVWYLRGHKTGFRGSDMIVDRIIRVTMQTGLLTSMVAIADLISYLVDPTGTHLIFNLTLCKLYSNSLLSSLNSRGGWKYNTNTTQNTHTGTVGTYVDKGGASQAYSDASQSGWKDNHTSTVKSTLFESMRPGAGAKPEVFVHVESHEMYDVGSQKKRDTFSMDARSADTFPVHRGV
ncbi:hypothetical protein P691DRAFT_773402 [Macrolepiota fuliginosa MF-IS2]|uniref:DUF6534 domain-containing protein n=1 Tax=Macrolepiota fuliginosa MF-IS2 TaxID=1400762 RepID=A0A9P5XIT0_9AGAR|nr:hypothetical protein P691DRAFT_773402 [Macrolepiota fuliginosa MF-IS2]